MSSQKQNPAALEGANRASLASVETSRSDLTERCSESLSASRLPRVSLDREDLPAPARIKAVGRI